MVILFSEENNIGIICEKSFDTVEKIECLNISKLSKMTLYVICLRRAKIQLPKSRNFTDVCIVRATHYKTFVKINFATLRSYTLFSFTFNLGNLTAEPCWRIFTTWSWSKAEKKKKPWTGVLGMQILYSYFEKGYEKKKKCAPDNPER